MANHRGAAPEWLNSEYVERALRKSEDLKNMEVLKIDITPGSADGDNYLCQIFRIAVNYKINTKENSLSIIGKYKVNTKILESVESDIDAFKTEARFFEEMPPLFESILNKTDFVPRCYHVDLEKNIIFMEDLGTLNYVLQPRKSFLSREQAILVLKALAEMHGASYKALQSRPELKESFGKSLWNGKGNEALDKFTESSQKELNKFMHLYDLPQKYQVEISKFRQKLEAHWLQVCDFHEDNLNFLLHGDCWKSNMLFHYDNDQVDKVKLLDFQIYNYNCFANDLQYFLFTSVSAQVILDDLDSLLETYYEKLRTIAPEIPNLTLDRIKKEFADRYYFGYILAVSFRPSMTSDKPIDLEKVFDGKEVSMGFESEEYITNLRLLLPFFEKVGLF